MISGKCCVCYVNIKDHVPIDIEYDNRRKIDRKVPFGEL